MMLDEQEARKLLSAYGIPLNESRAARTAAEAIEAARHIGFPVAVKALSGKIVHKSDLGLVELGVNNPADAGSAARRILSRARGIDPGAGIVVQAMAPRGTEVIVGAKRDPQFGPTVLFGLGGIFVEVFRDVSIRVAPVDRATAMDMIDDVRGYAVLKGARGGKPADLEALAGIIVAASRLMMEREEILELDLNPVMAYGKGALAVDARVLLGE
jgi:acyl-CoA synthetase (NDP forming)